MRKGGFKRKSGFLAWSRFLDSLLLMRTWLVEEVGIDSRMGHMGEVGMERERRWKCWVGLADADITG